MGELDTEQLLARVAAQLPAALREHVVVVGSIAAAHAFRDVTGTELVRTKDIDLLLRPAIAAVATAEAIGAELLAAGWTTHFPEGVAPADPHTQGADLPALRLKPPSTAESWFVELLGEPLPDQTKRKQWRPLETSEGTFGLISFRFMPVAVHAPVDSAHGLRVAHPATMALANLLEHSVPDRTPVKSLDGTQRFVKDVGRAVALWWLANEQSTEAGSEWSARWDAALLACGHDPIRSRADARAALEAVADYVADAHTVALKSVLAALQPTLASYERAYASLLFMLS